MPDNKAKIFKKMDEISSYISSLTDIRGTRITNMIVKKYLTVTLQKKTIQKLLALGKKNTKCVLFKGH